jgi:dipeptidyl aminopeptidase/acylaminoacyl peptidase
MNLTPRTFLTLIISLLLISFQDNQSQDVLSPADLLALHSCSGIQLSPGGKQVLFAISKPRSPNESPGTSQNTWWIMTLGDKTASPLFNGELKGSSPRWSPDGKTIGFLNGKGNEYKQVWAMPAGGGEIVQLTHGASDISYFRWHPGGEAIAYLALTPATEKEKELKARGYGFIYYEENLKNNNLFLASLDKNGMYAGTRQLTEGMNVWDFEFSPQGNHIAASISPKNLIDQQYMFRRIYLINIGSGEIKKISENKGKLGNYTFSPNGKKLAYTAALTINDNAVSQAYVVSLNNNIVTNLTPEKFKGHVTWVSWKNNEQLLYFSEEGVYPKLNLVPAGGGEREVILDASELGIIFDAPEFNDDFSQFVFTGSTPDDYVNVYTWNGKNEINRITDINPQLEDKVLGKQEVIQYNARDGQEIEGLLIYPVDYDVGGKYPLVVYVHGGPESHHSNAWLSRYSTPGQVMAGKGYMVLYLNYRASTGYGVDFAMEGFMDPAGKEFDDIADGIEYLIGEKGADRDRVGLAGGSYGGYASGWFATYYTEYVRAVCMFVGISDNISRRGTTDIPYEELYVHAGKKLEDQWQMSLERSPIYWAHQSKTATLIYGGAADTRVHPSQSMELYRRMKMNEHPAVRLVQYPGEGHGNRRQPGRIDVLYRQMEWFDWYVRDLKPLDGPMPRLDISDRYGLDWDY